jgi:hypothetical protein
MKVGSLVRTTSSPTKYLVVKVDTNRLVNNDVEMVLAINAQTGAYQSLPSQCYEVISESR